MTAHNLPDVTVVADAGTVDEVGDREPRKLAARKALGDGPGTRALVEVLLLHRHLDHGDVLSGITAAAAVGSVSPDVVAVEARKAARRRGIQPPQVPATPHARQVINLPGRHLAGLPADDRPLPSVVIYDDLLGKASS